jgi:hypothetical protein
MVAGLQAIGVPQDVVMGVRPEVSVQDVRGFFLVHENLGPASLLVEGAYLCRRNALDF